MKKCIVVLAVVGVLVLSLVVGVFAADLVWEDIARGNMDVSSVLVEPGNSSIMYLGSGKGIFKSVDAGKAWINILSVKGRNQQINFILFDPKDKNSLYAATGNGLFYSANQGRDWRRIFQGKNYLENECTILAVLPYGIYLGTKGGLFVSKDKGRTWNREIGKTGKGHVLAIAYNIGEPNYIYVASSGGIFKTQDAGETWERIFVSQAVENGLDEEAIEEDNDEEKRFSEIRYISVDPNNANHLYLASSNGVYMSKDRGKTWDGLTEEGLLSQETQFILVTLKSNIYAVTKFGVFEYKNERWHELSLGLPANDIRFLAQDEEGHLYAACNRGLFKASLMNSLNENDSQSHIVSFYGKDEPKISEVQEAAIKYAEVAPEKIKLWRNQAARKALLPQVSVGVDRNTSDLWHWEGGSTTKADDDILRRGRDSVEWDVTLSWNLGELLWNDDQTNIDVRSRLMVELREDILDQVTKLYFERLRVKMELGNLSIEDRKKRFEKELKLEELTAMLDALTGGYFSQELNKAKSNA